MKRVWRAIIIVVVIIISVFLWCVFAPGLSVVVTEVKRLPSPDNKVEAVLVSRNAGATGASYDIIVLPKGQKHQNAKKWLIAFTASHVRDLNFNWKSPKELEITYKEADIYGYRNLIYPFPEDYYYSVRVKEKQE